MQELKQIGLTTLLTNTYRILSRHILTIFVSLLFSVIVARTLGVSGYGELTLAIMLPSVLLTFLNLGIASANVYYIASKKVSFKQALVFSSCFSIVISATGTVVSFLVIETFGGTLFPGVDPKFLWIAFLAFPPMLLNTYFASLFQGTQTFSQFNLILLIPSIMTLVAGIISVYFLGLGVSGATISVVLGHYAGFLFAITVLKKRLRCSVESNAFESKDKYKIRYLNYGWKAYVSNMLAFLNYRIDIFILNVFLSPGAVGIYIIAVSLAERLWNLSQACSTAVFPLLAEMQGRQHQQTQITLVVARWVFLFTSVLAIFLGVVSYPLVKLLFGFEFIKAVSCLIILLPGIVLASVGKIFANNIAARGRPGLNLITAIIALIINVVANILLIPKFGIVGAAIATTLSYSINVILKFCVFVFLSDIALFDILRWSNLDRQIYNSGIQYVKKHLGA